MQAGQFYSVDWSSCRLDSVSLAARQVPGAHTQHYCSCTAADLHQALRDFCQCFNLTLTTWRPVLPAVVQGSKLSATGAPYIKTRVKEEVTTVLA